MLLAAHAVVPLADKTNMSEGGLTVMTIVIMVFLGALLIPVMLAGRDTHPHRTGGGPLPGLVPGSAEHVGESRTVVRSGEGEAAPRTRDSGDEGG